MSWIGKAVSAHRSPNGRGKTLVRWASAGWVFFIAENAVLSENRTALIDAMGDDNYHVLYGTISTTATAAIGYAYFKISSASSSSTIPSSLVLWRHRPTLLAGFGGWVLITTGMIMASQAAPKVQIPVALDGSNNSISVRCPFDFSDKHSANGITNGGNVGWDGQVHGLDRITRHPGLWSIGLMGLGQAFLSPNIPLRLWWM